MRVLVVEDDTELRGRLVRTLERAQYRVDATGDGREAEFMGATEPYDAIVLDLGLPAMDGLTILHCWRAAGIATPVIVLSARSTWRDRVEGLRHGADDYLVKPFQNEELIARVEALIRRTHGWAKPEIELGDIRIDMGRRQVRYRDEDVDLTGLEFRALAYLGMKAGIVVPQAELIEHVYDRDTELGSNVIEVIISRLRKKLHPSAIVTRRGHGYMVPPGA